MDNDKQNNAGGFVNSVTGGVGGDAKGGKKSKGKGRIAKMAAGGFVVGGLVVVGIVASVLLVPMILVGTIDYGLQSLGIDETVALLEEQGLYVVEEKMQAGEMPATLAADFKNHGIMVGQLTSTGDFVETNTYIAGLGEEKEVAADGEFLYAYENGELVMKFKEQIIHASEFVAAAESDPTLYAAYSEALNMSSRYYYSNEVAQVFKEMGISRSNFNNWEQTGDAAKDQESFEKLLKKALDTNAVAQTKGYDLVLDYDHREYCSVEHTRSVKVGDSWVSETYYMYAFQTYHYDFDIEIDGENINDTRTIHNLSVTELYEYIGGDPACYHEGQAVPHSYSGADGVTQALYYESRGSDSNAAKDNAAILLNTAMSSQEPYLAARAFVALEEPIQRARIDGDGPVNEVLNVASRATEITYTDVATGETKTEKTSLLGTKNFSAAISGASYDKEEAANFSRDRVINLTNSKNLETIGRTNLSQEEDDDTNGLVMNMTQTATELSNGALAATVNGINTSLVKENSETFTSMVGGNRVVEGGAFLSNTINQQVIGAMPSDEATIVAYNERAQAALARKAEAERATKSPFDVSSPNTFLGALMRNLGTGIITGKWNFNLSAKAFADDEENNYLTTYGDCTTVEKAKVKGDIYCSSHNTAAVNRMDWTQAKWQEELGDELDENGVPTDDSGYKEFIVLGMDREVTVGVSSAGVCEPYKEIQESKKSEFEKFFTNLFKGVLEAVDLYDVCDGVPPEVKNGAKYALNAEADEKNQLYSGYALYSTVKALIEEKESPIAAFKREYYATHPKDNSTAGILARRSGLTKEEVEIALGYSEYLDYIAKYGTDLEVAQNQ